MAKKLTSQNGDETQRRRGGGGGRGGGGPKRARWARDNHKYGGDPQTIESWRNAEGSVLKLKRGAVTISSA